MSSYTFEGIVTAESLEDGGKALICSLAGEDEDDGMFVMLQSWNETPAQNPAEDHHDLAALIGRNVRVIVSWDPDAAAEPEIEPEEDDMRPDVCGKVWLPHGRPGVAIETTCILDEGHFGDCSNGSVTLNSRRALYVREKPNEPEQAASVQITGSDDPMDGAGA